MAIFLKLIWSQIFFQRWSRGIGVNRLLVTDEPVEFEE